MLAPSPATIFEAMELTDQPGEWMASAVDYASEGEIYIAIFVGIDAEERAREYAAWKNGQEHPFAWGASVKDEGLAITGHESEVDK